MGALLLSYWACEKIPAWLVGSAILVTAQDAQSLPLEALYHEDPEIFDVAHDVNPLRLQREDRYLNYLEATFSPAQYTAKD